MADRSKMSVMDANEIAKAIRRYRENTGKTLRQVAKATKLQLKQVWLLENAKVKRPQPKTICKLKKAGIVAESTDPR